MRRWLTRLRAASRRLPPLVLLLALAAGDAVRAATDHGEPPADHGETAAGVRVLDDFEDPGGWTAHPADGVELELVAGDGVVGRALRLDVGFPGAGYAVAHKAMALELPENFAFSFQVRGELPPNHLEFKLIDASGDNVWWSVRRDFEFTDDWQRVTIKQRHIQFAWGPLGGGELRHLAAIELAITAGQGGTGSVWIDELELRTLPPADATPPPPVARASSSRPGCGAAQALDADPATSWRPLATDRAPWLELDLQTWRQFGGLVIDWQAECHAPDYVIELAEGDERWQAARAVRGGNGGRDYLALPEAEARTLRIRIEDGGGNEAARAEVAIAEVSIQPLEWSASSEQLFTAIAGDAPRGSFPRGITGEQSYWTVVGVDGDRRESLLGEDGALEVWPRGFTLEPFLLVDSLLVTWADVESEPSLAAGSLPIPSVTWRLDGLRLEVTAFAIGEAASASTVVRYRVTNTADVRMAPTLTLALRPFQVNPPSQSLNLRGGVAPVREIDFAADGRTVTVDGEHAVVALVTPAAFGATTFDGGDIVVDYLRHGHLPATTRVEDATAAASAALAFPLVLAPGATEVVDLLVPKGPGAPQPPLDSPAEARRWVDQALDGCRRRWAAHSERFAIELPPPAARVVESLESQLAYILINRDGPAIRPGTRAYDRSWIRDGSLTSTALLRLGHWEEVRDFIRWFAPHQFPSGKVPCVVDDRGADPVPEHDSSGQLIYLIAETYRYTGDRGLLEEQWPRVVAAVAYLDSLRQERRTPEFRPPGQRAFFGLLPPSISHEGYSAKPMHSYWDDFFALRGFRDAAFLAGELDDSERAARFAAIGEEFAGDLAASIETAMRMHGIDYVPGCADLGDFDPTSTTIALSPIGAEALLPPGALRRTFERYADFCRDRRRDEDWEAFTPYEIRNIGAFVRLGEREMGHELLEFFLDHQRPPGWRQWPEVVAREARVPRFLGDLPHTWVGSDYVRAVLDLFVYERSADRALVLAAGVSRAWLDSTAGIAVRDLRTPYGALRYAMRRRGETLEVRLDCVLEPLPPGGVVLAPPLARSPRSVTVDGEHLALSENGEIVLRRLPATVRIKE